MNNFSFRLATGADLDILLAIFEQARRFMASVGNPNQWIQGYPDRQLMEAEIAASHCYVCLHGGRIVGTFCFIPGPDPNYRVIEDGAWRSGAPYGTIHRAAGDGQVRGLFGQMVDFCWKEIPHLRVDTHEKNAVMRHLAEKYGFQPCGIIYTDDGTPRIALERL